MQGISMRHLLQALKRCARWCGAGSIFIPSGTLGRMGSAATRCWRCSWGRRYAAVLPWRPGCTTSLSPLHLGGLYIRPRSTHQHFVGIGQAAQLPLASVGAAMSTQQLLRLSQGQAKIPCQFGLQAWIHPITLVKVLPLRELQLTAGVWQPPQACKSLAAISHDNNSVPLRARSASVVCPGNGSSGSCAHPWPIQRPS